MKTANPDNVQVATSGKTVPRHDVCLDCASPMLYRVAHPESSTAVAMFCSRFDCPRFLEEYRP